MLKLKSSVTGLSNHDLESLLPQEIDGFFNQARKWDLVPTLLKSGSIIFPHTLIRTCGDQIAAAVTACLNSGASRVIVLGVLHSLDKEHVIAARNKVAAGKDVTNEACRGIFGPLFQGDQTWKSEYSLRNFIFLWNWEIRRRQIKNPPELIETYICLTNKKPWNMSGIEQLKSYLPNSVVIATTDFCHHGIAYQTPKDEALPIGKEAEELCRTTIEKGLEICARQNYAEYQKYSKETGSDGGDVGQVLMYLKGPLKSKIIDLRLVDTSALFVGNPTPSWVAASLIQMEPFAVVN